MYIILKHPSGRIQRVSCCDHFPTFVGDRFDFNSDSNIAAVLEVHGQAEENKVTNKKGVEKKSFAYRKCWCYKSPPRIDERDFRQRG